MLKRISQKSFCHRSNLSLSAVDSKIALVCAVWLSILTINLPPLAAADSLRTIALSGDVTPGSGPGVFIDYVNTVFPLGDGLVGFGGGLRGTGIETFGPGRNDYAILSESDTGLTMVVQRGDKVPGAGAGDVFGRHLIPIDPQQAGTSTIWANFFGTDNKHGIWHHSLDGGLELVALTGDPAPAIPDESIRIVRLHINDSYPVTNRQNQIGFSGLYQEPGVVPRFGSGWWMREADGVTRLVARSGDAVPGKPANFIMGGFQDLHLSDSGRFVSIGSLRQYDSPDRDGEFQRLEALLSETGVGTLEVVALQGQQAPGVEEGTAFQRFSSGRLALNGLGKMAFVADLTNGGQGLWTDRKGDGLTLIARRGDNAPGLDSDQHLFGLGGFLSINDRGDVAFSASYSTGDGDKSGLWMEQQGELQLIARTGDQLPGLPAYTAFSSGWILRPSDHPVALLSAHLVGPAIDATNDRGLWARSAIGELRLVARQGELLNVSDDPNAPDLRRIRTLHSAGIDDLGYISFGAFFVDGTSGVFVSSVVAVPEPQAGVLLLFGALLQFTRYNLRRQSLAARHRMNTDALPYLC